MFLLLPQNNPVKQSLLQEVARQRVFIITVLLVAVTITVFHVADLIFIITIISVADLMVIITVLHVAVTVTAQPSEAVAAARRGQAARGASVHYSHTCCCYC